MTNLVTYNIDDANEDDWSNFSDELENVDTDIMKTMDLDSKVDYLYDALEKAAKKCFDIKEKFKEKEMSDKKTRYIPKKVRNLRKQIQCLVLFTAVLHSQIIFINIPNLSNILA